MSERLEQDPLPKKFNIETSPAKEAYKLLGATTPLELSNLYSERDQELTQSRQWDYSNPELITNKIKSSLELIDPKSLTEDEREWRQEILWFWYHHAISCAVWKYKDKNAAQMFASKALDIQPKNHPNKITRLLFYLVHDNLEEAEEWLETIDEEPEKTTATELVKEFKEEKWFE